MGSRYPLGLSFAVISPATFPRIAQRSNMATRNTISALTLQDPSIISMLLSTAPPAIKKLVECGECVPTLGFPLEELDEIVDNPENDPDSGGYKFVTCASSVLTAIGWWTDVMTAITFGGYDSDDIDFQPAFLQRKSELMGLLNDALSCYASALAEDCYFETPGSARKSTKNTATVELLRRYRIYTRAVCSVAKDAWPEGDLDWLFKQV
jgi:hypothetical protein